VTVVNVEALADELADRVLERLAGCPSIFIDRIAERLAEHLVLDAGAGEARMGSGLIDAAEVARRLGVSRSTVYDHQQELGAELLGDGPRPRLRFDPARVEAYRARRSANAESNVPTVRSSPPRRARERGARTAAGVPLLPIGRQAA
jgi:predicted DNA-binding transcriptional regulator AlpA